MEYHWNILHSCISRLPFAHHVITLDVALCGATMPSYSSFSPGFPWEMEEQSTYNLHGLYTSIVFGCLACSRYSDSGAQMKNYESSKKKEKRLWREARELFPDTSGFFSPISEFFVCVPLSKCLEQAIGYFLLP